MTKEETVMALREEYLAGKSDEKREEFLNKPMDKQYSTLQTWKHRKQKTASARKPQSASEKQKTISDCLADARKLVNESADLSEASLAKVRAQVDGLYAAIREELVRRRESEIADLERQQREIMARLEELRNEREQEDTEVFTPPPFEPMNGVLPFD